MPVRVGSSEELGRTACMHTQARYIEVLASNTESSGICKPVAK